MKPRTASVLALVFTTLSLAAQAEKQNLSAKLGGQAFESDDEGITYLMPTKTSLNVIAASKGAMAYPPPKTLTDRLAIQCKNFAGKPVKYAAKDFGGHGCEVVFTKGESRQPMGEPQAQYRTVAGGNNSLEITAVKGKVIEGKFAFELVETKTKAKLAVTDGTFKAEDRQQ